MLTPLNPMSATKAEMAPLLSPFLRTRTEERCNAYDNTARFLVNR